MHLPLAAACTATLFAPFLVAQTTTVFPSDFATEAGDSYEGRRPFSNGISRTQFMYDRLDLPLTAGRQIQKVGFRQDNTSASTGQSIQLAIYIGGTLNDVAGMTSDFANNYNGTPRTLDFGPAVVHLPTFTSQSSLQQFWITLTTPYTVRANENLLVEYVVTANNNANQAFNYYLDKGTYRSPTTTIGVGCQTSAGQVPQLTASSSSHVGGNLSWSLQRAPASSLVWLNLDFQAAQPINAGPFGAPGCTLYVLPVIAVSGQGNTSGSATFSFPVPNDPQLFHAQVFGQCAIYDLFANNLGFAFSNGAGITLGMHPHAATVYASGSATATTGTVRRNDVPVSLFETN